jgi:hypothetical protein
MSQEIGPSAYLRLLDFSLNFLFMGLRRRP